MNTFPRSINTNSKLDHLISYLNEADNFKMRILFYSPWVKASKIKGYDVRVNLFEVPHAFHQIMEELNNKFREITNGLEPNNFNLNYSPTLVTVMRDGEILTVCVNDNPTAINYELTSV